MIHKIKEKSAYVLVLTMLIVILLPVSSYAANEQVSVTIPFEVFLQNGVAGRADEITVVMEASQTNTPMPAQSRITITNAGRAEFPAIIFSTPGNYTYRVFQESEQTAHIIVDKTIYLVTVQIAQGADGHLQSTISVMNSNRQGKEEKIEFTNIGRILAIKPQEPVIRDNINNTHNVQNAQNAQNVQNVQNAYNAHSTYNASNVKTGDSTKMNLYIGIMGVSLMMFLLLERYRKRKWGRFNAGE